MSVKAVRRALMKFSNFQDWIKEEPEGIKLNNHIESQKMTFDEQSYESWVEKNFINFMHSNAFFWQGQKYLHEKIIVNRLQIALQDKFSKLLQKELHKILNY